MPGDKPIPPTAGPSELLESRATDQKDFKLKRNVSNSVFALAANAFLAFWSYRLVIQSGGIELLGLWSALQAWLWLVRIGDLGVAGAATRFLGVLGAVATDRDRREIIDTALAANIAIFASISVLGYVVMSVALPAMLPGGTDAGLLLVAQQTLPIMFISFFLMGIFYPLNGSLMGLYVGYLAARLSVLGVLLQLGLAVLLIPLYGLLGLALAQLVQSAFLVIAAWVLVVRQTRQSCSMLPFAVSLSKAKEILRYSVRLQVVSLASAFYDPIAKVIVGYFGGLTLLGLFELANRTVQLPRSAVGSGVMAVLPAMTNLVTHDHENALELYRRTLKRVVVAMTGITVCVAIGAPVASYFWLGSIDSTYLWMVGVLMVGQFANAIGAPGYAMGLAAGRLRSNLVAAASAIGTLILVSFALRELINGFGAVLAVAAGLVIGGVLTKVLNERRSIAQGVASERLL